MHNKGLLTLFALVLAAVLLAACAAPKESVPTAAPYTGQYAPEGTGGEYNVAEGDPAAGEAVFAENCSRCHSIQEGETIIGPSLYKAGERFQVSYIRTSILVPHEFAVSQEFTELAEVMPENFADVLTAEQIEDVIAYLASLN